MPYRKSAGFSLIELAIALTFLMFLMGSIIAPMAAWIDVERTKKTKNGLEEIKEALVGYAVLHSGRLPCPDTDGDGYENQTAACTDKNNSTQAEGYVPWADLGVGRRDGWQRPFRYRADENYTALTAAIPATMSRLKIKTTDDKDLAADDETGEYPIAAIIFSCGKNGLPDSSNGKSTSKTPCVNISTDATFAQDTPGDGFDDILTWLPRNTLITSLIKANIWTP